MITTAGRDDVENYFAKSGSFDGVKLKHHPFLAFVEKGTDIEIQIIDKADRLLDLPDDTKVMGQWGGQWKSDFFRFTVAQAREYMARKK